MKIKSGNQIEFSAFFVEYGLPNFSIIRQDDSSIYLHKQNLYVNILKDL